MTLEMVAEETRIAMSNLTLIEQEAIESLPDPVFVKGFLRSYAQAIGADGNEAVRLYEARINMKNRLEEAEHFSPGYKLSPWRNLLLSIIAVAGFIALSLYAVYYFQHRSVPHEATEISDSSESAPATQPKDSESSEAKTASSSETPKKFVLQISALEETWVKIIVDNQEPKEYNLRAGDKLEEEATAGYNLLIGNAGGLELTLNGEAVIISGKSGEVVNIQIP